jgi:activator of HSP90 ATPase
VSASQPLKRCQVRKETERRIGMDKESGRGEQAFPARRKLIGTIALGAASVAASIAEVNAEPGTAMYLYQDLEFETGPSHIYEALLDEKQFSVFTRARAEISREAGGTFRLFQGRPDRKGVTGFNLELIPNERIVQAWHAGVFASGVYSIVRFQLIPQGTRTRLIFDQVGLAPLPTATAWSQMYWDPLRKYLQS